MRQRYFLLAALAATVAVQASAEPSVLKVNAERTWKHEASDVKFPAAIAGLSRDRVIAYTPSQTDVAATYLSSDDTEITVFLYRDVSGDVPLWFDRASTMIRSLPDKYPNARSLGTRPFTPRGQKVASGLIETFEVDSAVRSTALIVFPVNGFYAKFRASSRSRDAASLEQLLLTIANGFDWSSANQVAAKTIVDCAAPLPVREPAEVAETAGQDRTMRAMIGGALAQATGQEPALGAVTYCREPGRMQREYGIYRPNAASDRYLLAFQDAGRAVEVGDLTAAAIFAELGTEQSVPVALVDLDSTETYQGFKTLPSPEQVMAMLENSNPLSVASTWGNDRTITIASE